MCDCCRRETRPLNIWKTGANLESAKTREELKARVDKLKQEHPEGHPDIAALELKLQQLDQQSGAAKDGGADGKKAVVSGGQGAGAATDERTETWKDNDALLEEVRITVSDYLSVISINNIWYNCNNIYIQVRKRVKKRLTVDPLEHFRIGPAQRYDAYPSTTCHFLLSCPFSPS